MKAVYLEASREAGMMLSAGCYLAMLLVLAVCCMPVRANAEDLLLVYLTAKERDPVFDAARYTLKAAEQKLPQARAALLPVVSLNSNSSRQDGNVSFSDGPLVNRGVRSWANNLQLSQPLFHWANWVAYDQTEAQLKQAGAQFSLARQELILRVAQAYFDVLVAGESITVSSAQLKAVEQQLGLAKRNFEVGTSTVTDVHEATSRFDLARAQRIAAINEHEAKQAELDRIVGNSSGRLAPLRQGVLPPAPQPAELEPWLVQSREQHPLVFVQQAALEVAEREVKRQDAAHLPTLDLTASYGANFSSGSISSPADVSSRVHARQVGLQLSIPIFSGGGVTARGREAAANFGKASAELETARRQAATLARQAFSGVTNGLAQMEALASAVQSSKSSVDANKVGYRIGTRINVDVLNAEQQLFAAQRDLSRARAETLMQGLRLKAATGMLGDADVEMINTLLDSSVKTPSPSPSR